MTRIIRTPDERSEWRFSFRDSGASLTVLMQRWTCNGAPVPGWAGVAILPDGDGPALIASPDFPEAMAPHVVERWRRAEEARQAEADKGFSETWRRAFGGRL